MNFSDELIEKAKSAKTAEELIAMAKAENIELTSEEATDYFAQLNQKSGEISDEELDNVAGGACYRKDGRMIVLAGNHCKLYKCKTCGRGDQKIGRGDQKILCACGCVCNRCEYCAYCTQVRGDFICNNPANRRKK